MSACHPVLRGSILTRGVSIYIIYFYYNFFFILVGHYVLLVTRSVNHGLFGVGKQWREIMHLLQPKERDLIIMFIDFLKHGWQVWPKSSQIAQKWDKTGILVHIRCRYTLARKAKMYQNLI